MLFVHAGAKQADRNEIEAIPLPEKTRTYLPLPYNDFIDLVKMGLGEFGYDITGEEYAISTEGVRKRGAVAYGAQLFGVLTLAHEHKEFSTCLGLRSSYDKSMSNGVCVGNKVFVCDNMAFIGDMKVFAKHTINMLDESNDSLQAKLRALLNSVPALIAYQDEQLQSYRAVELTRTLANDFAVRCAETGVYSGDKILKVVNEFKEPRHPEFEDKTMWSMVNCVTEILKHSNIFELQNRTNKLYALATKFTEDSF